MLVHLADAIPVLASKTNPRNKHNFADPKLPSNSFFCDDLLVENAPMKPIYQFSSIMLVRSGALEGEQGAPIEPALCGIEPRIVSLRSTFLLCIWSPHAVRC